MIYSDELINPNTNYFVLDSGNAENSIHKDIDFEQYSWKLRQNKKLKKGDIFILRRPRTATENKLGFYLFGAGKIGQTISSDENSSEIVKKIEKPLKFKNNITMDSLSTFKWHYKERGKDWRNFFTQYGITQIDKEDFIGIFKAYENEIGYSLAQKNEIEEPYDENMYNFFTKKIDDGRYYVDDNYSNLRHRTSAQKAFADKVKNNYDNKCPITGISTREFLVGSHIVPWKICKKNRINPQNGICLSSIFDVAFDRGFITFQNDGQIKYSDKIRLDDPLNNYLRNYKDVRLNMNKPWSPKVEFLEYHQDMIFDNKKW